MSVLVGKKAPHFSAGAVINGEEIVENFSLAEYAKDSYSIFLLLPKRLHFCLPYRASRFSRQTVQSLRLKDVK